jgi:hypothetical protein
MAQWGGDKKNIWINSLTVTFNTPCYLEKEVTYLLKKDDGQHVIIELFSENKPIVSIEFFWSIRVQEETTLAEKPLTSQKCNDLSIDDIDNAKGKIPLYLDMQRFEAFFPNLFAFSKLQIAQIIATTRLVGMECPGLNSIFSSLNIKFSQHINNDDIAYETTKIDKRFGLATIKISSDGMSGIIHSIIRQKPQKQISFCQAKEMVGANEFASQRALIIGGSRGLGEITTKLLAAGEASVRFTYNQGKDDANLILDEIQLDTINALQYNIFDDNLPLPLEIYGWRPTHLYYFPTPFILTGENGRFSNELFKKFYDYYVLGINKIFYTLVDSGLKSVFYPSSIFVQEIPCNMSEYAIAKSAGEQLCNFWQQTWPNITIYTPRLPRINTDQTANIFAPDKQSGEHVLLKHIRILNSLVLH